MAFPAPQTMAVMLTARHGRWHMGATQITHAELGLGVPKAARPTLTVTAT